MKYFSSFLCVAVCFFPKACCLISDFSEALRVSAGLYSQPSMSAPYNSSVMIISCNFAVMDILLNWACHANRIGLKFLLISMDNQLATESTKPYFKALIPHVYHGEPQMWKSGAKKIDPKVHNVWRNGQFNLVSLYKLASVRDAVSMGYNVLFTDIDIVLLNDPIPTLFPPNSKISSSGVIQPLPDFTYQQNICGWNPKDEWKKKEEGNTGMYFILSTKPMVSFLDEVISRSWRHTDLDDQTNLFDELTVWRRNNRAVSCIIEEDGSHQVHGFRWSDSSKPSRTDGLLYTCPLPRLPFATGYGHRVPLLWKKQLENNGIEPILLHFNCLGRGGGHDMKRLVIEEMDLWHWQDDTNTCNTEGNLELKQRVPKVKTSI